MSLRTIHGSAVLIASIRRPLTQPWRGTSHAGAMPQSWQCQSWPAPGVERFSLRACSFAWHVVSLWPPCRICERHAKFFVWRNWRTSWASNLPWICWGMMMSLEPRRGTGKSAQPLQCSKTMPAHTWSRHGKQGWLSSSVWERTLTMLSTAPSRTCPQLACTTSPSWGTLSCPRFVAQLRKFGPARSDSTRHACAWSPLMTPRFKPSSWTIMCWFGSRIVFTERINSLRPTPCCPFRTGSKSWVRLTRHSNPWRWASRMSMLTYFGMLMTFSVLWRKPKTRKAEADPCLPPGSAIRTTPGHLVLATDRIRGPRTVTPSRSGTISTTNGRTKNGRTGDAEIKVTNIVTVDGRAIAEAPRRGTSRLVTWSSFEAGKFSLHEVSHSGSCCLLWR